MYPKKLKVKFSDHDQAYLVQLSENTYCCPVCGFDEVDLPYASNGSASYEVCPDCGVEYGFDDQIYSNDIAAGITHEVKWEQLRSVWLAGKEQTPALRNQLKKIGVELLT